jgi:hypothetical protein
VPVRSDFNRDKSVDISDMAVFAENWLKQNVDVTLSVNSEFAVNASIVVAFEDLAGNKHDWIGICKKGSSIEPYAGVMIRRSYSDGTEEGTAGIVNGSVTFEGLPEAGDYEVRAFFNDSYEIEARAFFRVN